MAWRRRALLAVALAGVSAGAACWGDTILMTDGRVLEGQISRRGDQVIITQADGVVVPVQAGDMQKVTLSETRTPAQLAQADWDRTLAQIKKSDNLADIIRLHKVMLAAYPDAPVTAAIQDSLATYEKMAAGDYVRFRSQWVSRVKVEVLLRLAAEKSKTALELYRASRLKDALDAANEALKLDEENPTALAVAGLATYRQNQLPVARDYFGKLATADNANVLAWNNLAVIAWDQKHPAEAMLDYTKALGANSDNRLVLDNIAEAINAYPGPKDGPLYLDLARQYNLAEAKMEAKLAKVNLYRLGSTWVSREDRDKFNTSLADVRKNMNDLDTQYQQAVRTLSTIDEQIKAATDTINSSSVDYNNATATVLALQARGMIDPYWVDVRDQAYQNYDRATKQRAALELQKTQLIASVKQMRADAGKYKTALAANQTTQFAGFQRIMEIGEAENPPAPVLLDPAKVSSALPGPAPALPQAPAPAPGPNPVQPGETSTTYVPPVFYDGPGGWWPPPGNRSNPGPATQPTSAPRAPPVGRWKPLDSSGGPSLSIPAATQPTFSSTGRMTLQ